MSETPDVPRSGMAPFELRTLDLQPFIDARRGAGATDEDIRREIQILRRCLRRAVARQGDARGRR